MQATLKQLLDLRLPIGWTLENPGDNELVLDPALASRDDARNLAMFWPGTNPDWFGLFLRKLIGIAITTIAVAQGAPFWFDLLRRLTRGGSG